MDRPLQLGRRKSIDYRTGRLGSKILTNYEQYLGSNTRTITPSLVNEARYGYTRFFNSIGTLSAFNNDVVSALGVPGLQPGAACHLGNSRHFV